MRIVIISGLSGSGKSTTNKALEDLGFFCVDNLPAGLLTRFLDLQDTAESEVDKFAFVMDTRERSFLKAIPHILDEVQARGHQVDVVFLECSDEVLQRRFSETRRPHPQALDGTVASGVQNERKMLRPIKERATLVIDTSSHSVHKLRREIQQHFSRPGQRPVMTVNLVSFGFKNGIPRDADIVMDVRFLPNPYFIDELREKRGIDPEVSEYVLKHERSLKFIDLFSQLINFLLPFYEEEGKSYLTIAIGCTGGHHRSVAIVEQIKAQIDSKVLRLRIRHRDL